MERNGNTIPRINPASVYLMTSELSYSVLIKKYSAIYHIDAINMPEMGMVRVSAFRKSGIIPDVLKKCLTRAYLLNHS